MAVKIEMEMPKSCQLCPLTFNFGSDAFCCLTLTKVYDISMLPIMKRHKNCPLKEVKEVKKNKWNEGYDAGMKRAYEQMLEAKENSVKE